jgi:hypothetical protein
MPCFGSMPEPFIGTCCCSGLQVLTLVWQAGVLSILLGQPRNGEADTVQGDTSVPCDSGRYIANAAEPLH